MALPARLSIARRAPPPPFRALLTSSFGSWGFPGEKFQLALFQPCRPAAPGLNHIFPQFSDPMRQTQAAEFVIVDSTELRTLSADSKSIRCSAFLFHIKLPPSV